MSPKERLAQLERGENPRFIARMPSGFVEMSPAQFLPGYCLLLASPMVGQLADLPDAAQQQFLTDMARVGAAVKAATGAIRINYAIYGNVDPFLHAHIWPRYADEPENRRTLPPLLFPAEVRESDLVKWSPEQHDGLLARIRTELDRRS